MGSQPSPFLTRLRTGDDLLAKVRQLEGDARRIAAKGERAEGLRGASKGVPELTRICELQGRLVGEIQTAPQTITVSAVGPMILQALEGYPEARRAVAGRLVELDARALPAPGG